MSGLKTLLKAQSVAYKNCATSKVILSSIKPTVLTIISDTTKQVAKRIAAD